MTFCTHCYNKTPPSFYMHEALMSKLKAWYICKIISFTQAREVPNIYLLTLLISKSTYVQSRYVSIVVEYHKKSFQHLTMVFIEGIRKICTKLKSHYGYLSYMQDRTAYLTHSVAIFCPVLDCPKKPSWQLNFLHILCYPLIK